MYVLYGVFYISLVFNKQTCRGYIFVYVFQLHILFIVSVCQKAIFLFFRKEFKSMSKTLHYLITMLLILLTFIFIGTTNTTSDIKTERDIDKKNISATTGYIFISEHFEKILVILAGTVSSLILLMFIAREIYKLFRMSETCSSYQFTMVTPVVNTTSDDTTEFLDNSLEHRGI